jgi:hypothetical protein
LVELPGKLDAPSTSILSSKPASSWSPSMNPGQDRVFVVPQPEIHELYREYAQTQLDLGNGELMTVHTLPEALHLLGLYNPDFQPLMVASSPRG